MVFKNIGVKNIDVKKYSSIYSSFGVNKIWCQKQIGVQYTV